MPGGCRRFLDLRSIDGFRSDALAQPFAVSVAFIFGDTDIDAANAGKERSPAT